MAPICAEDCGRTPFTRDRVKHSECYCLRILTNSTVNNLLGTIAPGLHPPMKRASARPFWEGQRPRKNVKGAGRPASSRGEPSPVAA